MLHALPPTMLAVLAASVFMSVFGGPKKKKRSCDPEKIHVGVDFELIEANGAKWGDDSPTLIVFHGLGSTPAIMEPFIAIDTPAKIIIPYGTKAYGKNFAWWKERAASEDQAKLAAQMKAAVADVQPLIDAVNRCNGGPVVVAGHSQGGMMTYALARYAKGVDAAVGGSGWLPESMWGPMVPTIAVHGYGDTTVPFDRTEEWAEMMAVKDKDFEWWPVDAQHGLSGELKEAWQLSIQATLDAWS